MEIKLIQGDITSIAVDAIVNAANTSLLGGGGVDGAIHRKGGAEILHDCRAIRNRQGGCRVGQAVITRAGNLPARYVIHTVGPRWNGGNRNEPKLLLTCYLSSLKLAEERQLKSIAFPNISTGIYGFPKKLAAQLLVPLFKEYAKRPSSLEKIILVAYDKENYQEYYQLLEHPTT